MILFVTLLPLLLVVYWLDVGIYLYRRGRYQKKVQAKRIIDVQYEPPTDFRPAEVGYISNIRYDSIASTLVDLAIRGYILITEDKPGTAIRQSRYKYTLLKSVDNLEQYETQTLNLVFDDKELVLGVSNIFMGASVFKTNSAGVKVSQRRYDLVHDIMASLSSYMQSNGHLVPETSSFDSKSRKNNSGFGWAKIILSIVIAFVVYCIFLFLVDNGMISIGYGILFMILLLIFPSLLLDVSDFNPPQIGQEIYWIEGFKLFLSATEEDRTKFENAPKLTAEIYIKFLPYAIALGVERNWSAQFADIALSKNQTAWFAGSSAGFNGSAFANNLFSTIDLNSGIIYT